MQSVTTGVLLVANGLFEKRCGYLYQVGKVKISKSKKNKRHFNMYRIVNERLKFRNLVCIYFFLSLLSFLLF